MPNLVPVIIEKESRGERSYDIYSRLLKDRIIMLDTDVNSTSASLIVAQMLFLESTSPGKAINFYINSPGGSVTAGMSIYDTMQFIKSPVHTTVMGIAASMGSFLAMAGEKGKRAILNFGHTFAHGIEATTNFSNKINHGEAVDVYVKHTGVKRDKIAKDMDRDFFMSAKESIDYGLADFVAENK